MFEESVILILFIAIGVVLWYLIISVFVQAMQTRRHLKFLVLEQWQICETGATYVTLHGRKEGFIAWLLYLCGLGTTGTFMLRKSRAEFYFQSSRHLERECIPLTTVCNAKFYWGAPIGLIVMGILSILVSFYCIKISFCFPIFFILGIALIGLYFLGKRVTFELIPTSGQGLGIRFRPPLGMSSKDAYHIFSMIETLVKQNNRQVKK